LPFLEAGRIPIGSLGTYVQRFRFNDPVFATLERAASPQIVAGLAVLVGLVVAGWSRSEPPMQWGDAWAWPMAASLICAPAVYPWYLLWLLPFLRSVSALPLTIWTVSILSTYFVWHSYTLGHPWQVTGWILLLEYGPVATAAAFILVRRSARPAMPNSSAATGEPTLPHT
jgi:alpha-1,6-mannosyltransferase